MNMNLSSLGLISVLAVLAAAPAWSQPAPPSPPTPSAAPPAREVPRPDQLEPGVDTSATPPSGAASETNASAPAAPSNSASGKKGAKANTASASSAAAKSPSADANTARAGTGSQANAAAPKAGSGKAQDRLELDTTQITGNRELPKVLYIVPWKRSDLGDLVGKPPNSLLDEVLAPVDRDVFKRENRYYDALKPDAAGAGTPVQGAPAGAASPASAPGAAPGGPERPCSRLRQGVIESGIAAFYAYVIQFGV
jgi:hypothetical protein